MNSPNKKPFETLSAIVEKISILDGNALADLGCSTESIKYIQDILNNYSHIDRSFLVSIITFLLDTHATEQGLLRFERFLDSAGKGMGLGTCPLPVQRLLAIVWASSFALSNRLSAHPAFVDHLIRLDEPLRPRLTGDYYRADYLKDSDEKLTVSENINDIHLHHSAQLMRICARNANVATAIEDINAELSLLADATIDICLDLAGDAVFTSSRTPSGPDAFFVLGLGKLGGMELNVSSDIDLIYLCDRREGWHSFDDMQIHTSLAERLTAFLAEATELGALYRVDTRLRADGASGPLVKTTEDYFRYLEMRGEAWERQMLLKARPVAGDIAAGHAFLDSLSRFVYPTGITRSPNREIVSLKNQIESRIIAEGSKKTHLKLMAGGIRDIEFIVQCLQLLMGGKHSEVRCTGTLSGMVRLHEIGALNDSEYEVLSRAYRLYRRIENALQWRDLLPAFTMPETPDSLRELDGFLGCRDTGAEIGRFMPEVRNVYNAVFSLDTDETFEDLAVRAAVNPAGDEQVRRFLENLGFTDPQRSAIDLSVLAFGRLAGSTELSLHPSIERFIPILLRRLAELPDPGGTLERFSRIAESYNVRSALFDILEHNGRFLDLLLSIAHGSVFLTETLVKDPSLLDWLVESGEMLRPIDTKALNMELSACDTRQSDDGAFTRECLKIKLREKLRLGTRDITGLASSDETLADLTRVAECILGTVHERAFRTVSARHPALRQSSRFCIIAGGKLGASIMDFGSDLDLIFVYDCANSTAEEYEHAEFSAALAQHILFLITGGGGSDKIYDVDARLRPEGGGSPLAISAREYERYCENRASVWERLALVRARFIAGSSLLGPQVMDIIHRFVYGAPFSPGEVNELLTLRRTIERVSAKRYGGMLNVKSGPGGTVDIDFIAQSYAAHYGRDHTGIHLQDTAGILNALADGEVIPKHDATTLKELYAFLQRVEKAIRIGSGKAVNALPESGIELSRVARLLDFRNVRKFSRRIGDVTALARELYTRLMQALLDDAKAGRG